MTSEKYPYSIHKLTAVQGMEEVVQIWMEGSKTAHAFIEPSYWLQHVAAMREVYLPQSEVWVYKGSSGRIAGFVSLVESHLAALFIHPDQQGRGIGSKLIQWAKELKDALHLTVYAKNTRAVTFYQQHHFEIKWQQIDVNTGEVEFYMEWLKAKG
ncbi:MAG TPA: GNAT family N-acetyltransferase [Flavisolibacter sp.]|nr:GNAT family N-acetyltransferase [Flavisolibacter sp.]